MRDLRNHGGDVVDRVQRGEHLTVTRSGRPAAQLVSVRRLALKTTALLERWRGVTPVDPGVLRDDLDAAIDPGPVSGDEGAVHGLLDTSTLILLRAAG